MQHEKLDLTVHVKSPKSGKVIRVEPYRMHVEGKIRYFEKPAGSKLWFFENGEPVSDERLPESAKKLPAVITRLNAEEELNQLRGKVAALKTEVSMLDRQKAEYAAKPEKAEKPVEKKEERKTVG